MFDEINENDSWIIEGTLRKHLFYLYDMADKIIYLDIPIRIRKRRIFTRFIKQLFRIEKCNYKVNFSMLKDMYKWTKSFEKDKENFEEKLFKYKEKIVVLRDNKFVL